VTTPLLHGRHAIAAQINSRGPTLNMSKWAEMKLEPLPIVSHLSADALVAARREAKPSKNG